jgi:hypothetical protein
VKVSTTEDVWRRRGWHCKASRAWFSWGNLMQYIVPVGPLLTRSSSWMKPRQEHPTTFFHDWYYTQISWRGLVPLFSVIYY